MAWARALVRAGVAGDERAGGGVAVPERGYNQSELVARLVARRLGVPYCPMLGRVTSEHQMGLGRHERLEQIQGAFFALRPVPGARVLVVDDVITTGATLSECATTLSAAGAQLVWGAVVARH